MSDRVPIPVAKRPIGPPIEIEIETALSRVAEQGPAGAALAEYLWSRLQSDSFPLSADLIAGYLKQMGQAIRDLQIALTAINR